jgi:hypothetical protein
MRRNHANRRDDFCMLRQPGRETSPERPLRNGFEGDDPAGSATATEDFARSFKTHQRGSFLALLRRFIEETHRQTNLFSGSPDRHLT